MKKFKLNAFFSPYNDKTIVFGDNIEELREEYKKIRDYGLEGGYGASNMLSGNGNIKNSKGKIIANLSYNGRCWDLENKEIFVLN